MGRRLVALALVGVASIAGARFGTGRLTMIRLQGYVGPPPAGRLTEADLLLQHRRTRIRFQVEHSFVLSGDVLAAQVLEDVRPYTPNFNLDGPPELLAKIDGAHAGDRLEITGMHRFGTQRLQVTGVETPAQR
jgi:hypothetical protein